MDNPAGSRRDLEGFSLLFGLAEGVGAVVVILVAIWVGNYRGGFAWNSDPKLEFNWHPLLMTLSMVFLYGNGKIFS
jgi:cytochrome b-561